MKAILILLLLGVGVAASGCGGASDSRVSKLERRVAKLETENADLRKDVERTERGQYLLVLEFTGKIGKLNDRTWANDQALFQRLAMAQYDIQCGPNPQGPPGAGGCHVALGTPGAVYTTDTPRRIFVTP
jgi:hypothetical protein